MTRQQHARRLYAQRLCREGKVAEAREYCLANEIPWPPAPHKDVPERELVSSPASSGAEPADKSALHGMQMMNESGDANTRGVACEPKPKPTATPEEPLNGQALAAKVLAPTTAVVNGIRQAKVISRCPNPRLCIIHFEDGAKERASLWLTREFRFNERVQVKLERGQAGTNAIYEEVRKRI